MKKMTRFTLFISICFILLIINSSNAQELLYEIPMHTQVESSSEIIEGKVISKTSFWDANQHNIYTVNTVEVYKVFKGQTSNQTIEVITPGGTVGSESEVVTPSLALDVGDIGVFMLHDDTTIMNNGSAQNKFKPFASSQGFYKYDLKRNTVHNPFSAKQGITTVFYDELENLTNATKVTEIKSFDAKDAFETLVANRNAAGTIDIIDISPTTVNGGVRDQLTINGVGFGTDGTVEFRDANAGGQDAMGNPVYYTALASQIVSYSDTQIIVEVPSRAGTGNIRVTPTLGGSGADVTSSQTLTVFYSQINPSNGTTDFSSQHYSDNGNGGYTWQMFTDFDADAAAKASFLRAFDTWVCTTGVNWVIGAVTTTDVVADDGINIIRFDNGTELPQGVLGRCTSRFSACANVSSPGGLDVFVDEIDIVFNDAFTGDLDFLSWEFGPYAATSNEVDFESVAVHELGHGHQLAHIINTGAVMHYSIASAQNSRTLGTSDVSGGTNVMDRNVANQVCGTDLMTYSACSGLTLNVNENVWQDNVSIYPNPTEHNLNIKSISGVIIDDLAIYDIRGRLVHSQKVNNSNALNTIDVSAFQSGVYVIKLHVENTTISKKFLVE